VSPLQALVVPLLRPLNAAFALLRDDRERLGAAYLRASNTLLAVGTPFMLGLSALAGPAVEIALGPRWHVAAPILQWLAIASIPSMFVTPLTALALALNRTGIFFRQALIDSVTKIPMVVVGLLFFGLPGVIAARLASSLAQAATAMFFVRQLSGLSLSRQILSTWRTLVSGAGMYLLVSLLEPVIGTTGGVDRLLLIAALAVAGAAVYVSLLLALWWCCGCPAGVETQLLEAPRAIATRLHPRSRLARSAGL
jgi:O-antigen/teichoic acid export membrane protein